MLKIDPEGDRHALTTPKHDYNRVVEQIVFARSERRYQYQTYRMEGKMNTSCRGLALGVGFPDSSFLSRICSNQER